MKKITKIFAVFMLVMMFIMASTVFACAEGEPVGDDLQGIVPEGENTPEEEKPAESEISASDEITVWNRVSEYKY